MRNLIFFFGFLMILSCESDGNNRFCDIINNQTINLSNPEFINLQVPGGWSYANGGSQGLIIYNFGSSFKAFSRECPNNDACTERLVVENNIKMVCPCNNSEYSILDGSPQTSGDTQSVCEFRVVEVSNTVLNITNF